MTVQSDGKIVWAWGDNTAGQLSEGTRPPESRTIGQAYEHEFRSTPRRIDGLEDVARLTVCDGFNGPGASTYVVKTDGSAWAWGVNDRGQLGDGSSGSGNVQSRPAAIAGLENVHAVEGTMDAAYALKRDGTV